MNYPLLYHQRNAYPNQNYCRRAHNQWVIVLTKNSQEFCHIIIYRRIPTQINKRKDYPCKQ